VGCASDRVLGAAKVSRVDERGRPRFCGIDARNDYLRERRVTRRVNRANRRKIRGIGNAGDVSVSRRAKGYCAASIGIARGTGGAAEIRGLGKRAGLARIYTSHKGGAIGIF
jgi:hypothetical protein